MRLKSKSLSLPVDSSSASPMVLMADSGNSRRPSNEQVKSWRPCFNFAKGTCRFGSNCKFVHDPNAKSGDDSSSKIIGNQTDELLAKLLNKLGVHETANDTVRNKQNKNMTTVPNKQKNPKHNCLMRLRQGHYMTHPLASGTWIQDFLTRRVLLRCDSSGDLYPVTSPSSVPQALLVSPHTWHQRLGHPGSDVLRRLVSHNFISCNKEKPLVLCHACQLGKHARLPFVSSNTVVTSCFDIIHSDVWTSPIPSLSGYKYYVLFLDHYS
ncbi:ribonuclease H-like domain-containing protein [Tanacetum coccineum]